LTDTLLIGDSIVDWRTARDAPAAICLARYGFGFANFPASELRADERFVDAPADLVTL
jgi:phosphoglycolate phosphatase-like HAD superfamily hydrolase